MKWLLFLFLFTPSLTLADSSAFRHQSNHSALVGYQIPASWIPFKWAASYTYIFDRQWSAELEYSKGKFGLGLFGFDAASVTEQRYSLMGRRYVGNSFNLIIGAFKNDFHAELGDNLIDENTGSDIDDFRVQGIGLVTGIGNRWQWGNGFTLGIDWIRVNIPLVDKKVENDVLDNIDENNDLTLVKNSIRKVRNIPTFILFGLHLGYTF